VKLIRLTTTLLALSPLAAWAQGLNGALSSAQADLDDALARYATLQERIKDEKIPLDRELNTINAELREKRRDADRSRRLQDNSTVDLRSLEERVQARREQLDYVSNLISDFGERFDRDIDLSERVLYGAEMDLFAAAANRVYEDEELAKASRLLDQIFILQTALGRFDELIGGKSFTGSAVAANGDVEQGTVVAIGPTYFFTSNGTETTGLILKSTSSEIPPVVSISPEADTLVRSTLQSGEGPLPIDPTLGSAFAIAAQQDNVWEHIQKGGIWIWPILFFAALAFLTALFKLFEIYSVQMPRPGVLHDILKALNDGNVSEAAALAEKVPGPARAMLCDAVAHSDESKELIEEIMYERMLEVQPKLERMLPFIAVTAATAPLMGLLGTVTGMINTFELITVFGTGDARKLSSGISEALITTEFGLIVAIPSLIMHALLNRRAQGVMANMERMAVAFVNGLNRKA